MIVNIVGGGPAELLPDLRQYDQENCVWVGVDRGVSILLEKGIIPALGFGDFDSVSEDEWREIERKVKGLKKFLPEKDEPDMELALNWGIEQGASEIRIFGGTGGRLDHFLANVQLLLKPIIQASQTVVMIVDQKNQLFLKQEGIHPIHRMPKKKYISFIPITNVENLSLIGFKYPLTNRHIPLGSTLCISNELNKDSGTFSFTKGILLVIRSCD
ncbi:thiamine diphosphokinase [Bacillus sp. 1NLA3E]|uniref:thiamine diphosphokinase n=1 Tax=Bacillus sp. 1NLA3E TaxID=666686 RepID=UPI000247E768|nr:thiamine diphosphokinase [Bacillus sp. 1NLA3E]AGK53036.1 thiamine pyrophosphokinase [Bacillus sp. 1NLA3E]